MTNRVSHYGVTVTDAKSRGEFAEMLCQNGYSLFGIRGFDSQYHLSDRSKLRLCNWFIDSRLQLVCGSWFECWYRAYYPTDKMIVLWECFFDSRFHKHPFATDTNMQQLWQSFESYLLQKFPKAETLATPFNDPIAESIEEYQAFLKTLGYSPLAKAAYGKKVR
jgi:hypothetical protein